MMEVYLLKVYLTMFLVAYTMECRMLGCTVSDELERMWKEAVML
jgi:hypothetical protein